MKFSYLAKATSKFAREIIPFISFIPFFLNKLALVRTRIELIEFREWIYASREVLKRIEISSKLSKYSVKSEKGEMFDSRTIEQILKFGYKATGIVANNIYLNGGGYRASSKVAIERYSQYENNCEARKLNLNNLSFFGPEWTSSIGHATKLSIIPKLQSDDLTASNKILIYTHAANHFYLSLLAEHYTLCRVPEELKSFLVSYLDDCLHPLDAMRSTSAEVLDLYSALTLAEVKWNQTRSGRNFLKLPQNALEQGMIFLQTTKLNEFEWFVVLHMREAPTTAIRGAGNVEIASYISAIKEILNLGGAVVRIGNSGMTRIEILDEDLAKHAGYFDYANSEFKNEVLDVYLMANCRFMIGTSSGPIFIPKEFGKSVLYTNAPNVGILPGIHGYCLPNIYQNESSRNLKLSEMLKYEQVGWKMSKVRTTFKRVPNSREDIRQATLFMAKEGYKQTYNLVPDNLNKTAAQVRFEYRLTSAMPICPTFLSSHSELLE